MWAGAVLSAFFLLQAANTQTPDWQSEGIRALEQKNYPAAIEALTKATAADPKDYGAHFNLAFAYSMADRDEDAIAEYRKTIELKPDLYQANLNLGILLLRNKRAADAIAVLEQAVKAKPTDARPLLYLADARFYAGSLEAAADAYEGVLRLDSKSANAEAGLGRVLLKRGQPAEAEPHLKRAAELDPSYEDGLLELAEAYQAEKKTAEAVAIFSRFPQNPAAAERAGELLLAEGKHAEAAPHLETAVRLSPTSANRLALATAYIGGKQLEKGVQVLNQALTADPKNFDLRMLAGRVLRDQKQFAAAVQQFLAAAALRPDSAAAWGEVAASSVMLENVPQALAALDKVKGLGAEQPTHIYLRAILLDKQKMYQPALENYQKFLAIAGGKFPEEEFKSRQRARIIQKELSKR